MIDLFEIRVVDSTTRIYEIHANVNAMLDLKAVEIAFSCAAHGEHDLPPWIHRSHRRSPPWRSFKKLR